MPIASIKIGVDLDPIPAVKGCVTFQCDITTQRCLNLIKKELKHFKADLVLNDGAPNVGANWSVDSYNQIELSLYALKLSTETLRKGGTFITKVFRSKDYNALMYVANQLFTKVESNKPQSSRNTSAEIFMVCQGYKAPDYIDPKLLDPKYALEEVEEDKGGSGDKISSLKKLLTNKRNRSGYADDAGNLIFAECDLMEFIKASDPHEYLQGFNKFHFSDEAKEELKDIKLPADLPIFCQDLKACGRKEFSDLLKVRIKYLNNIEIANREANDKRKAEEAAARPPKTQEELEAEVDRELEQTMAKFEKIKKRAAKKQREMEAKQDIRKKMSVIASNTVNNDDDMVLDKSTWDKLKQIDIEDADKYIESSSDDDNSQDDHNANMPGMSKHLKKLEAKDDKEQVRELRLR